MSVQLFVSETFITLALFLLGVTGYALSKHGRSWLLQHRAQRSKSIDLAAAPENKAVSQEMPLAKKVSTQSKNAEARRRAKRETRGSVQDELVVAPRSPGGCTESAAGPETPSAQYANDERCDEQAIAPTVVTGESSVEVTEELNAGEAEAMLEVPASMINASKTGEHKLEQQPLSPESSASTLAPESTHLEEEEEAEEAEEEGTTTPGTHDEAELSEHLQQDTNDGDNRLAPGEEPCVVCALVEGEEGLEQDDPKKAQSEIDGSDFAPQDFAIPPTPPYGEDEVLMPAYTLANAYTPTSAAFTDGNQVFEPMPALAPDGQQLYTDGQQVFMLACVEVSPSEPNTPCVGTSAGALANTDSFGMHSRTYGDFLAAHAYGGPYGNDEVDDLWNVSWEDSMPEAFTPPANQWDEMSL